MGYMRMNKKRLCGAIALLGFLLILGMAGSIDLGTASIGQSIAMSIIGIAMFAGGTYFGGGFH